MSAPSPSRPSLALDASVSPNAKAVYLAAVEWIEVEDVACTYARLSEATGLQEKTLQRAVKELEEGGHVRRSRVGTATHVELVTGLVDTSDRTSPVCVVREKRENLPSPNTPSPNTPNTSEVVRDLEGIGVKPSVARKLAQHHPEELIRSWIAETALRADRNQAGFVVAALKRGWELPPYYTTKPFTPHQIAEAAFFSAAPEIQRDLIREAHKSDDPAAKKAREIARGLPHLREGLDNAAAVNFLADDIEARTAPKPVKPLEVLHEVPEPLVVEPPLEALQGLPAASWSDLWDTLASEIPRG